MVALRTMLGGRLGVRLDVYSNLCRQVVCTCEDPRISSHMSCLVSHILVPLSSCVVLHPIRHTCELPRNYTPSSLRCQSFARDL